MPKRKILTADETSYICEQLAYIIKAGIPFHDGLEIITEDMDDSRLKGIIDELCTYLHDEKPIFTAMEETKVFPSYAIKMIEIGTLTGRLESVLTSLSEYYDQQSELKRTITSAVLHPLMLLCMMAAVIIVLVVKVIPMFKDIFSRFDESAGAAVEKSISTAYSLGMIMLIIMFAVIVVVGVIVLLTKIPTMSSKLKNAFSKFFLTRKISESIALTYFCSAMCMMSSSGIESSQALEYAEPLINNDKIQGKINSCYKKVIDGESFADAIHDAKILPAMQAHTLKISYQSGSFDQAWKKISEHYDEETNRSLNNLVAFIEPLLIVVLAVVIGAVLLTVMLPLMDIMSSLG